MSGDDRLRTAGAFKSQQRARYDEDHHAIVAELLDQLLGYLLRTGGDQDAVVRGFAGPAEDPALRRMQGGPRCVLSAQVPRTPPGKGGLELHAGDRPFGADEPGQERRRPPRTRAYIEHAHADPGRQQPQHVDDRAWLRVRLPVPDRQRPVLARPTSLTLWQELTSIHGTHRLVNGLLIHDLSSPRFGSASRDASV